MIEQGCVENQVKLSLEDEEDVKLPYDSTGHGVILNCYL